MVLGGLVDQLERTERSMQQCRLCQDRLQSGSDECGAQAPALLGVADLTTGEHDPIRASGIWRTATVFHPR